MQQQEVLRASGSAQAAAYWWPGHLNSSSPNVLKSASEPWVLYQRGARRAPHRDTLALLVEALSLRGLAYDELLPPPPPSTKKGSPAFHSGAPTHAGESIHQRPASTNPIGRETRSGELPSCFSRIEW